MASLTTYVTQCESAECKQNDFTFKKKLNSLSMNHESVI